MFLLADVSAGQKVLKFVPLTLPDVGKALKQERVRRPALKWILLACGVWVGNVMASSSSLELSAHTSFAVKSFGKFY